MCLLGLLYGRRERYGSFMSGRPTQMKRILVIDESEVVRETLALILGREFAVSKRPLGPKAYLTRYGCRGRPVDTRRPTTLSLGSRQPGANGAAEAFHRAVSRRFIAPKARLRFGKKTKTTVGEIHAQRANRQTRSEW